VMRDVRLVRDSHHAVDLRDDEREANRRQARASARSREGLSVRCTCFGGHSRRSREARSIASSCLVSCGPASTRGRASRVMRDVRLVRDSRHAVDIHDGREAGVRATSALLVHAAEKELSVHCTWFGGHSRRRREARSIASSWLVSCGPTRTRGVRREWCSTCDWFVTRIMRSIFATTRGKRTRDKRVARARSREGAQRPLHLFRRKIAPMPRARRIAIARERFVQAGVSRACRVFCGA
jgi:hypothetical protein